MVENVARPRWANVYDMADDEGDQWWADGGGAGGYAHNQNWYTPQQYQEQVWEQPGEWGPCQPWGYGGQCSSETDMDTADVQVPLCMAHDGQSAVGPARAWQRRKLNNGDAGGVEGRHVGAADEDAGHHEEAARVQAAINDAGAAAPTVPAPPTPNLAAIALEKRKQEVWDLAQDQDIEVAMETIAKMDAETLEEWATKNLL